MPNISKFIMASVTVAAFMITTACTSTQDNPVTPKPDAVVESYAAAWDGVRDIITQKCARCHTKDRLCTYRRLVTHAEVTALRTSILEKIQTGVTRGLQMPVASNHPGVSGGCTPAHEQINDKTLTAAELAELTDFLIRDAEHQGYADTNPSIVAPAAERLADSIEYTSSTFDVVNDGFITDSDSHSDEDEYMDEKSYDERDYDQMEDDWFCIEFDPERTDLGYVTGVQVLTGIGQIFLNAQLVIDTTDASEVARAAADEHGSDWYRCDGGLGFEDAIPLWRTVPGGEAIELPDQTGLRFEPGWKFILRVDFHTHYDSDEFNDLEQNGVIDYDAGTMTWHNQLALLVRWAEPADISRELNWLAVGPQTNTEKDDFLVVRGESSLTYTASIPPEENGEGQYSVFSAELAMGKYGHTVSLSESNTTTCIGSNADFAPKWIEHAMYAEEDAPQLDNDSVLSLQCVYRNNGDKDVVWASESEATVWGKKEMCQAVVFYYKRLE